MTSFMSSFQALYQEVHKRCHLVCTLLVAIPGILTSGPGIYGAPYIILCTGLWTLNQGLHSRAKRGVIMDPYKQSWGIPPWVLIAPYYGPHNEHLIPSARFIMYAVPNETPLDVSPCTSPETPISWCAEVLRDRKEGSRRVPKGVPKGVRS